jgi:hypothetical protein
MAGAQIPTSVTILNSLHGFMALSLKNYATSAAASIAAGSIVEIAGAFFTFAGDEAIEASTWTSIVTGQTAYINLTASGTAGSQIVAATYTNVAPTWRDDLQGWYASAASSVRIIGSVYKAEATNYANKYLYAPDQISNFPKIKTPSAIINNIPLYPFRATSETIVKNMVASTWSALTVVSTVYGIMGIAAFVASGTTYGCYNYLSGNTMIVNPTFTTAGVSTNITFYVTYLY